jgi:hypothetical protein
MGAVVRLGAAYANLTADQLREMLGAARATHHREILGMKERWAAEVSALRQAMTRSLAQSTAQLQEQKSVIASLRRELDVVYTELAKANAVITEQGRKLQRTTELSSWSRNCTLRGGWRHDPSSRHRRA